MKRIDRASALEIRIDRVERSRLGEVDFANLPFGTIFSDHMLVAEFDDGHWSDPVIRPYGPLPLAPSISALHYGVSAFEGLKVHRSPDGHVSLFRPMENARRLQRSAARLAMPAVPETLFLEGVRELVRLDEAWVPPAESGALYVFFVLRDKIVTPELTGTILPGVTRDSVITLLRDMDHRVEERRVSVNELLEAHARGELRECFGTGTAAVVAHLSRIRYRDQDVVLPLIEERTVGPAVRERLVAIMTGRAPDPHGWLDRVC